MVMENRGAAYELQDIPDLSRDRVEHGSSNAAVRRSRPRYADPILLASRVKATKIPENNLLSRFIFRPPSRGNGFGKKMERADRPRGLSKPGLCGPNAAWITAIGAVIAAIVASLFLFTH